MKPSKIRTKKIKGFAVMIADTILMINERKFEANLWKNSAYRPKEFTVRPVIITILPHPKPKTK